MDDRPLVMLVFGTRPEAVKMAPVIWALHGRADVRSVICVTGQHWEMLDQVLGLFDIQPDIDFALMKADQSLSELTAKVLVESTRLIAELKPAMVLVQGDTSSAMAASLASFFAQTPVGHIEAGLRTGDLFNPYPEEMNRKLITNLSTLHFAPTATARSALLAEHIAPERIFMTGNPVVDALHALSPRARERVPTKHRRMILVTVHRRENFGKPLERICSALRDIAKLHPDVEIVVPVHPNPHVHAPVRRLLGDTPRIRLVPPMDYVTFIGHVLRSVCVLTDSGGVQEEAPTLGVPVLVLRRTTERPDGIVAGAARLVGDDPDAIVRATSALLTDPGVHARMAQARHLYGDGQAGRRIVEHVAAFLANPVAKSGLA